MAHCGSPVRVELCSSAIACTHSIRMPRNPDGDRSVSVVLATVYAIRVLSPGASSFRLAKLPVQDNKAGRPDAASARSVHGRNCSIETDGRRKPNGHYAPSPATMRTPARLLAPSPPGLGAATAPPPPRPRPATSVDRGGLTRRRRMLRRRPAGIIFARTLGPNGPLVSPAFWSAERKDIHVGVPARAFS